MYSTQSGNDVRSSGDGTVCPQDTIFQLARRLYVCGPGRSPGVSGWVAYRDAGSGQLEVRHGPAIGYSSVNVGSELTGAGTTTPKFSGGNPRGQIHFDTVGALWPGWVRKLE